MKTFPSFSLIALSSTLVIFGACQKSDNPEKSKTVQIEQVENHNAAAQPTPPPPPVIATGTWIGTMADGSDAATLTIDSGNRATIVQQDSPTSGSYSLDASKNPVVFTFIPDGVQGQSYFSQIQWVDENTVTMTSFINSPNQTPAVAPVAPPAAPTPPKSAPFTGNVPPPSNYVAPDPNANEDTAPAMDPVISTITFRRQASAPAPAATAVSP